LRIKVKKAMIIEIRKENGIWLKKGEMSDSEIPLTSSMVSWKSRRFGLVWVRRKKKTME